MNLLTVKIPNDKASAVSAYIKKIGGEIVAQNPVQVKAEAPGKGTEAGGEDDEVTHGSFFGENISRVIKAFARR